MPYADPVPGVIPHGTTTLLVGSPHAGKTIELVDLACRLRDGRSFCGHPTNPQRVGIITTDHRWQTDHGVWFARAGWPEIPHVSLRDRDVQIDWDLFKSQPATRRTVLRLALARLSLPPGATLLVDVGQIFITHQINDYAAVYAGLAAFSSITCDQFHLTTIATAHMGKQRDAGPQYRRVRERIAGSVGLIGFTDQIFSLQSPDDTGDPWHTLTLNSRLSQEQSFQLMHSENGLFVPYAGDEDRALRPSGGSARLRELVSLLPVTGLRAPEWLSRALTQPFAASGYSRATFWRDVSQLRKLAMIRHDVESGRYFTVSLF